MYGVTRAFFTLLVVAVAGFLVWVASQIGDDSSGEYWTTYGLVAAAGLTMALSQLLGGWTKWGWPTLSGPVFLLGFLPALIAGGWILLAAQPADWGNTSNWSRDFGIGGLVDDLGEFAGVIAFGIGLVFGLTFDTSGRHVVRRDVYDRRAVEPVDQRLTQAPVAADEETAIATAAAAPDPDDTVVARAGDAPGTPVAPQPDPPPRES